MARPAKLLQSQLAASRTPEQAATARVLSRKDLLGSLWTPITVFGVVFLIYVLIVELHTPAYLSLQPPLKAFGLLMVGYFVALLVYRNVLRKEAHLRKLRRDAGEAFAETDKLLAKHGETLKPEARERLLSAAVALDHALIKQDPDESEFAAKAFAERSDEALKAWRKGTAIDVVGGFAKAFMVAMLIRTIFIEPFKIPSGSMIPTLEIGDQVFVNKFLYGVRIPFTNEVPFQIVRAPARGDVIVFNNPRNTSVDYIKRVIGVPGDEIRIDGDELYVNGDKQQHTLLEKERFYPRQDSEEEGRPWHAESADVFREKLAADGEHLVQFDHRCSNAPPVTDLYRVPEGHVFVMGDNRNCSADSRYGLGIREADGSSPPAYVPFGHIKGKAMVIWLSLGYHGFLHGPFGGTGLRTDRLFLPVR